VHAIITIPIAALMGALVVFAIKAMATLLHLG